MTNLIARLHAQAEKRGIATHYDGIVPLKPRHPLEISHEVLGKCNYDWMHFIEVVVALAEREA